MLLLLSSVLALAAAPATLQEVAEAAGVGWPPPALRLEIDKSDRTLTAWSGAQLLATFPVGLGDPEGDKVRQGDHRTPEGRFKVVTRNPKSQFHLFLGLSYPTAEDAERGLRDGLISANQATAIKAAEAAGRQPPWETPLGGAVGIHGGGSGADWTWGCIALDNEVLDQIWPIARVGTVVEIRP